MKTNSGNVLFLILIAVILFAALSYAITRSSRDGGADATREKSDLYAAQIVETAGQARAAMQRMQASGISVDAIVAGGPAAFVGALGTLNGGTNFCTTGTTCLLAPEGGGLLLPSLPRQAFAAAPNLAAEPWLSASYFAGANSYIGFYFRKDFTIQDIGTSATDYLMIFDPLTKATCLAINRALGISGIPLHNQTANISVTAGQDAACIDFNANEAYFVFYSVLQAR